MAAGEKPCGSQLTQVHGFHNLVRGDEDSLKWVMVGADGFEPPTYSV